MAEIRLEGVGHSYDGGRTWALKPTTWTWRSGRAYALLGPSGCGKTTLLNIVSGLLTPTEGRVLFDGRDVTGVPTAGRDIAQVFQFPVLYEEMSVYDNLAFPLRNRRLPKAEVDRRVREVSRLLGLDPVLGRRSRRLDPGRQQIVCLGRGLVRPGVAAVLLDEPLTVVDPALKWTLRSKLKEIHRDTGHTLVYVTHDQTEALTFADEVVVLNEGAIVQAGEPAELFLSPAHEFVGHFIGSPGMNVLPAEISDGVVRVGGAVAGAARKDDRPDGRADGPASGHLDGPADGHADGPADGRADGPASGPAGGEAGLAPGPVRVGVRPEFVRIGGAPASPGVPARVSGIDHMGAYDLVHALVGEHRVTARAEAGAAYPPGAAAFLHFAAGRAFLFRDQVRCGSLAPLDDGGTR
ncbi:ABC transporter ATP-binding protein [Nonomuraea sp. NPDC050783]|uniref:ABC transporter ATP-binding protein n=1 Tax=Nonomuraea sp. NPDC050783 TaxID=3154634 RepID=UPI00346717B3